MDILELINQVKNTAGVSAKIELLKANRTTLLDAVIKDAMDPDLMYGISAPSKEELASDGSLEDYDRFRTVLMSVKTREFTGNAAKVAMKTIIGHYSEPWQALLCQILDKNLNIGVSWQTYKEKVMGISEKFEVALAHHLEKVKNVNPIDGTYYASRKCDGVRCIAIITDGSVVFKSRQNKVFTTLDNLKADVLRFCNGVNCVLDGELCKVDDDGNEDFQAIMKEIRRKDYSIKECCYQVFDALSLNEFNDGKSEKALSERFATLEKLNELYIEAPHGKCWVKPLKQEKITTQEDFDRWSKYVEDGDWEGFMLRRNVPYQSGRTKDLLKVKKFFDEEAVVESVEIGEMATQLPGQGISTYTGVSALVIEHKGSKVKVGSGISREQRIEWCNNPELIVGKTITVKYFEETTDKNGEHSLRFPTLKYVYDAVRDL